MNNEITNIMFFYFVVFITSELIMLVRYETLNNFCTETLNIRRINMIIIEETSICSTNITLLCYGIK